MATPEPPTEHQCDHPRIPLRDALRIGRIVAWVAIIGQAAAVVLFLYGTAPPPPLLPASTAAGCSGSQSPVPTRGSGPMSCPWSP